ncbi:hypothetical protein IHE55_10255 [Streptomyces pactum]|uniref:Uncharacterized protein n=1 Tax=Streptomyces pactum TaxID=68249 RepID=A0ABS0NIX7_9ACTN|nr:hypothetical protein [Streptomyces pactum]MBH5335158.1 hypothetical protein [Streptomyces pactum]
MMSATSSLALTHAAPVVQLAKELDKNKVTPGVLGFLVFAVIGVAVWMLMKSMNKHMKKVDFEVEPEPGPKAGASAAGTGKAASGTAPGKPSAAKG